MNILKKAVNPNLKGNTVNTKDYFLIGKDETLEPKFTRIFGYKYIVNIYYLRVEKPELFLEKNSVSIYLPISFRNNVSNQSLINIILYKMYKEIAEKEIENIMEKARHVFGFAPEDYEIRKIENTLASCDKNLQTFTINPYIVTYSREIVEYIIFHEFCHLKYQSHSKKFYDMLKDYVPNYEVLSKQVSNLKY